MNKWIWAVALGIQAHFAASYLVPLREEDRGAFAGLLKWFWPWGMGSFLARNGRFAYNPLGPKKASHPLLSEWRNLVDALG